MGRQVKETFSRLENYQKIKGLVPRSHSLLVFLHYIGYIHTHSFITFAEFPSGFFIAVRSGRGPPLGWDSNSGRLTAARRHTNWATPHPSELRRTLWATPHPVSKIEPYVRPWEWHPLAFLHNPGWATTRDDSSSGSWIFFSLEANGENIILEHHFPDYRNLFLQNCTLQ